MPFFTAIPFILTKYSQNYNYVLIVIVKYRAIKTDVGMVL